MAGWGVRAPSQQPATPRHLTADHVKISDTHGEQTYVKHPLKTILKTIAASGFLTTLECTSFVFGRGSVPDAAGGAYSAPQTPSLV